MELQTNNFIDKQYTNIIKGVALIFMFIHHFFTFPERLINGISYNSNELFAALFHDPFKICVSIFAFLTGYFYYFNKNKSIKYSVRKSTDIYLNYLIVLILMLLLDSVLKCYPMNPKNVFLEMFLISTPNMVFCWYVAFFIIAIFLLPFYAKIALKSSVLAFSLGIVFSCLTIGILRVIKENFDIGSIDYFFDIIGYIMWFPCVASGFIFAQESLFQKMDFKFTNSNILNTMIYAMFILFPFLARKGNTGFDFIFAPLFIFGLVNIIKMISIKCLHPISIIGKYSLLMWFIHSVFFNVSKDYTQPILYFPHNPILVLFWGLIICLSFSILLSFPINWLVKVKNKLFGLY